LGDIDPQKEVGTKTRLPLKRQRRYHSFGETQGLRKKLPVDSQKAGRSFFCVANDDECSTQQARAAQRALGEAWVRDPSIEEHSLPIAGGRMRYLKAGSGRPLILVHGLLGYSFSWRFTMPALAAHATVYAIDNLGAGLSPAPIGLDCSVRAAAGRVLQFADSLGLAEFDLLGTSHGGAVAMMAAALAADQNALADSAQDNPAQRNSVPRVRRLVLVAPVNPWSPRGRTLAPFLASPFGSVLFRNTVERWRGLDHIWLRRLFGDAAKIPPDSLAGYRIPILANHGFQYGSQIVKTWLADLADLESVLPKIRSYPTLLIWGTADRAVHFASAEALRQNFSDARLIAFEGVGHLPYEECPQQFNRVLLEFLTSGG
jgi:pimeloyl-ACP methyl ester carboxylesterase